jgi:hypothetical protein
MGRVVGTFQFFVDPLPACNPLRIRAVQRNGGLRSTSWAPLSLAALSRRRPFITTAPCAVPSLLNSHRCALDAEGWPRNGLVRHAAVERGTVSAALMIIAAGSRIIDKPPNANPFYFYQHATPARCHAPLNVTLTSLYARCKGLLLRNLNAPEKIVYR